MAQNFKHSMHINRVSPFTPSSYTDPVSTEMAQKGRLCVAGAQEPAWMTGIHGTAYTSAISRRASCLLLEIGPPREKHHRALKPSNR